MDNARSVRQAIDSAIMGAGLRSDRTVDPEVAAIITVESDLRYFKDTVTAVFRQTVLPGTVIIADCADRSGVVDTRRIAVTPDGLRFVPMPKSSASAQPPAPELPERSLSRSRARAVRDITVHIVSVTGAASFTDAVGRALDRVQLPLGAHQMWLLHDDSRPADDTCLAELLRVRRNTPTVSVIGAKQLDWEGTALHNVGYYMAPHHRIASLVVDGEPDQEQYDARQDVFAVSLAGALVSDTEWERVSGGDRHVGTFADSRDFCRRICLSRGRVIVAPNARIAHRRARYEGVRTAAGAPVADGTTVSTYSAVRRARDLYLYSDISRPWWVAVWLWRLLVALVLFVRLLVNKRPFAAACEFIAPWRNLVDVGSFYAVRRNVSAQSVISQRDLSVLAADREQLESWNSRRRIFASEKTTEPTNQLVEDYLHQQARIKHRWAFGMTLVALVAGIAINGRLWSGLFSGAQAVSDTLLPTGTGYADLARAATSTWSFAGGMGTNAAPMPFLLVLLVLSTICLGHVTAAICGILLLAAPLSALSFWALTGIVTRSNPVRVLAALSWVALGAMSGLYADANLPMLIVSIFLPAGIAFVFKAVGMYRTEERAQATPSAQSAAFAALCLAFVVAAEPQYVFALAVSFVLFFALVRSHRSVLLLVPLPAAFVIAPALARSVLGVADGNWRQLFGDIMLPTAAGESSGSLLGAMLHEFGYDASDAVLPRLALSMGLAALLIVTILAVVSLCLPSVLRISRMMWVIVASGIGLAVVSRAVLIGVDGADAVHGSVLPGLFLAVMGLVMCMCMLAGTAAEPFARFVSSDAESVRTASVVGRVFLCVLLALCAATWGASGAALVSGASVHASDVQLPMVVTDYLSRSPEHRVLTVKATSDTSVDFSIMHTSRGDLVDESAAVNVQEALHGMNDTDARIASDVSQLLVGSNAQASSDLESLGFGGVYVLDATGDSGLQFVSHLLASGNTQSVIDKDGTAYVRFTTYAEEDQGVDASAQDAVMSSGWRKAWICSLVAILVIYCLVAQPFGRSREAQGGDISE